MKRSFFQFLRTLRPAQWPGVLREMFRDGKLFLGLLKSSRWSDAFAEAPGERSAHAHRVVFSTETSTAFHAHCKQAGATVNDGLVSRALQIVSWFTAGSRVAVAYTVNMRKFLPTNDPIVGNFSGFLPVSVEQAIGQDPACSLGAVSQLIGEHKKGLPGLGSNLIPLAGMGWLPHGLIRRASRLVRQGFLAEGRRAMVMTNVGQVDEYLAPFGESVRDAWVTPPTFPGFPAPITLASTFRNRLSVCIGGPGTLRGTDVARVALAWQDALLEFAGAEKVTA